MIPWAPITQLVGWLSTNPDWKVLRRWKASHLGKVALEVAREEIGKGESGGNNRGADLDRYRGRVGGPQGAWCASFVSFCVLAAVGRLGWKRAPIKRSPVARTLFRRVVQAGMLVDFEDIQPGDVVLWARGPDGSWKAHIGIVSRVNRNEGGFVLGFKYIAGNEGDFPATVRERWGHSKPRRIGFARLP